MREVNTQVDLAIDAPADEIWAYRFDFLHLPEYNSAVQGIECVDRGGPNGSGAGYRFDLITGSHSSPIELRVTEAVPGERIAIEMSGALPARETFSLSAVSGETSGTDGCVATIALTLLVPDHFPLANDAALLARGETPIAGELARMREILETSTERPAGGERDHG